MLLYRDIACCSITGVVHLTLPGRPAGPARTPALRPGHGRPGLWPGPLKILAKIASGGGGAALARAQA